MVADLTCSPNAVCSNIVLSDIDISSPEGDPPVIVCDGIDGDIGVDCQSSDSVSKRSKLSPFRQRYLS